MSEPWERLIPRPRSSFIQVMCNECGNRQILFDSAKTVVRCNVCGAGLCKPAGGKSIILAKKERVLE
ncbi:MAG: 30S ribosomal protein S27e [Candidatus Caldarchaeum sp.]